MIEARWNAHCPVNAGTGPIATVRRHYEGNRMRHKVVRLEIVALAVGATVATVACGSGSSGNTPAASGSSGPAASAAAQRRLALIQGVKGDEFYVSMACGAQAEAAKRGATITVTGPDKFDPGLQTPIVNAVTAQHPDAVLVAPTDSEAMIPPLQSMKQAGIKIVEVDTTVSNDSIAVSAISSDNEQGGVQAAKALTGLIGDKGSVLVINVNPGISTTDARASGFAQELKNHPNVHALGVQYSNDDPAKAASIVSASLAAHPDLAGIFATNVLTAEGVATGLRNSNAQNRVKIVGFDAGPKQVEDLKSGVVQALVAQEPYQIGVDGVDQAMNALEGKPVEKTIKTDLVALTKADLDNPDKAKYVYQSSC